MQTEKEYKTGFSVMLKISTIIKLDEYASKLNTNRADVGRRILEYFLEHNDIEDLKG